MNIVFHGTLIHHLKDLFLAKAKTPWTVERFFEQDPREDFARALADVVHAYGITEDLLMTVIDGMAMDLDYNRYPDFDTLKLYCHRVAGVVGLMSARIFGYSDERTLDYAAELGLAFQLTNIIRDVGEDARKNRIYLPIADLQQFGVGGQRAAAGCDEAAVQVQGHGRAAQRF